MFVKSKHARRMLVLLISGVLAIAGAGLVLANDGVSIMPGSLSISTPTNITWTVPPNGNAQSIRAEGILKIVDATGSGNGWHLALKSTSAPTEVNTGATVSGALLTVNGSTTSQWTEEAPTSYCGEHSTCTLPSGGENVLLPVIIGSQSATILSAGTDSGMGTIVVPIEFWLSIPQGVNPGTYTVGLEFEAVSGP